MTGLKEKASGFLGLNSSGMLNIFLLILVAVIAVIALPSIIMFLFPTADLIIRIILVFAIFMTVRGYLGNGLLTVVVSGVLIYFLVIKWAYFTAAAYIALFFLLSLQVFSIIIFGIGMGMRKG